MSSAEAWEGLYTVITVVDGVQFYNLTEHTLKPFIGDTVREWAFRTECSFGFINIKTPPPHLFGQQLPNTKQFLYENCTNSLGDVIQLFDMRLTTAFKDNNLA